MTFNRVVEEGRMGRFRIHRDTIRSNAPEEAVFLLFSKFIIVDARYDALSDEIEYSAYSYLFEKLRPGDSIPEYGVSIAQEIGENGESVYTIGAR